MTEQKNIVGIDVSKDDFQVQFITVVLNAM